MLKTFRYIDDVENWLGPMGYDQFWSEIRPYCLVLEYRHICDAKIETGQVSREDILFGLKGMASYELTRRHRLVRKPATPWLKVITAQEE